MVQETLCPECGAVLVMVSWHRSAGAECPSCQLTLEASPDRIIEAALRTRQDALAEVAKVVSSRVADYLERAVEVVGGRLDPELLQRTSFLPPTGGTGSVCFCWCVAHQKFELCRANQCSPVEDVKAVPPGHCGCGTEGDADPEVLNGVGGGVRNAS